LIAGELFRSMLPQCEADFLRELEEWHPDLVDLADRMYLRRGSFPRCWVVTAALIFATSYAEYGQWLLGGLRTMPRVIDDRDAEAARACGPRLMATLNESSWRGAICGVGPDLYRGPSKSLVRIFAVGLNFTCMQPGVARSVVQVVQAADTRTYEWQVAAAGLVVRMNPIQALS
jgi:hypothetical protein